MAILESRAVVVFSGMPRKPMIPKLISAVIMMGTDPISPMPIFLNMIDSRTMMMMSDNIYITPSNGARRKVLVIHGPNLHLLGKREPEVYGGVTLEEINGKLREKSADYGLEILIIQSNSESEIVEKITADGYDFLIINPAAYTHTSIAIRDAISGISKPAIEVHLSNIHKREDFRKVSFVSEVALGVISGLGKQSYLLALKAAADYLGTKD